MVNLSERQEEFREASFSVAARVAMQLGRESISNSIIAITELVKNSYDADSEHVLIQFFRSDPSSPILVIQDDGAGMNEEQVINRWMVIGTANKRESKTSKSKKRILAGEKGLGRLGLDRLCSQSVIQSFTKDAESGVELIIDWEKYEDTDKRLEEIKHPLYRRPKEFFDQFTNQNVSFSQGTRIILLGLKDIWDEDLILSLRKELSLLLSPFSSINDFSIEIVSGLGQKFLDEGIGSSDLLNAAEWRIYADIDENNNIQFKMTSPLHTQAYDLPKIPWSKKIKNRGETPKCGPLSFEMYFFPRRNIDLANFSFSKAQIEKFLEANQGVRIYRDQFRVKPYGQPNGDGDWLNLSYRRQLSPGGVTQGQWRVGYNQVVGAVYISREVNQNLNDQTNREGILEGPAYFDMRTFVIEAVRFFELNREDFERKIKRSNEFEESQENAAKAVQNTSAAVSDLRQVAAQVKTLVSNAQSSGSLVDINQIQEMIGAAVENVDKKVVDAQKAQDSLVEVAKAREEEYERQKNTLSNLASLGILTSCFGHETISSTNLVLANAGLLKHNLTNGLFMVLPDVKAGVENNLQRILTEAEKVETFANFALRNIARDKRTRKPLDILAILNEVFSAFEKIFGDKNISLQKQLPESLPLIIGFPIDWESIFVNLITNSIWAMQNIAKENRVILVTTETDAESIVIHFSDSGIGLEKGTEDNIFLPTFSTKRNSEGDVIGTGMGLAIVKNFIDSYDGSISAFSPSNLGGAEFIIRIPLPKHE
jgi:signal transduction histidine kinase